MHKEHNLGVLGKWKKNKAQLLSGLSETKVHISVVALENTVFHHLISQPCLSLVYFKIMVIGKEEFHQSADKSLAKERDG